MVAQASTEDKVLFVKEQPRDPGEYRDDGNPDYVSVWRFQEWKTFEQKYGMHLVRCDQGALGHRRRKPTIWMDWGAQARGRRADEIMGVLGAGFEDGDHEGGEDAFEDAAAAEAGAGGRAAEMEDAHPQRPHAGEKGLQNVCASPGTEETAREGHSPGCIHLGGGPLREAQGRGRPERKGGVLLGGGVHVPG